MIKNDRGPHGALANLRALVPARPLSLAEALNIAERQAERLLELHGIKQAPVPDAVILSLPRIRRVLCRLHSASGVAFWKRNEWVIGINRTEPRPRQRFTLMHEFKHIIDHRYLDDLSRIEARDGQPQPEAEQTANYFAGCVLMPKGLFLKAWRGGMQRVGDLAAHFEVSEQAVEVRLWQLGLRPEQTLSQHLLAASDRPLRLDNRSRRTMPELPTTWRSHRV